MLILGTIWRNGAMWGRGGFKLHAYIQEYSSKNSLTSSAKHLRELYRRELFNGWRSRKEMTADRRLWKKKTCSTDTMWDKDRKTMNHLRERDAVIKHLPIYLLLPTCLWIIWRLITRIVWYLYHNQEIYYTDKLCTDLHIMWCCAI